MGRSVWKIQYLNPKFINAQKKIVLSYSLQPVEKFIRKKQLYPYFKHKPKIFLLGEYHKKKRSIC